MKRILNILIISGIMISGLFFSVYSYSQTTNEYDNMDLPNAKTKQEWKKLLTPLQYQVLRESATERAFTGEYYDTNDTGVYYCAGCGDLLFRSDTKFDSGCGWPSFFEAETKHSIIYKKDQSYGMHRTEVLCGGCGGHLGHVFNDGPPPTGLRFCINSASLHFEKDESYKE